MNIIHGCGNRLMPQNALHECGVESLGNPTSFGINGKYFFLKEWFLKPYASLGWTTLPTGNSVGFKGGELSRGTSIFHGSLGGEILFDSGFHSGTGINFILAPEEVANSLDAHLFFYVGYMF